jgi:hypothetical protein
LTDASDPSWSSLLSNWWNNPFKKLDFLTWNIYLVVKK